MPKVCQWHVEKGDKMVSVSMESAEAVDSRLRSVIAAAELRVYPEPYEWREFSIADFPSAASADALAFVRDDEVWSQLVPASAECREPLTLFRFQFPTVGDNSGFVGWLATLLKKALGTGIVVTCGSNSERGGIYDYWACPAALGPAVIDQVRRLRCELEN